MFFKIGRAKVWLANLLMVVVSTSAAEPGAIVLNVDAAHPGAAISPQMFGIFFEDINFGADGGLYPELVKNRSFEFSDPLMGWHEILAIGQKGLDPPKGEMAVRTDSPLNESNPHYLRVRAYEPGYGLWNSGFRGMGVTAGAEYRLSAFVRTGGPQTIRAVLTDPAGGEIGQGILRGFGSNWKQSETVIRVSATTPAARLNLFSDEIGSVDLDMISLFPVDTWQGRRNGLRKDLVQLLADMHPGFVRFPGGCIVEGRQLATRYRWKQTVGDVVQRPTLINRWNDEFDQRPAPDYFQSFGLGFYEYFQLAEDIGARPLPILNCGMACQFNSSETAKLDDIKDYAQDALDLIEFANGPSTTVWGGLRTRMGHPHPFGLTMIGVGNEQWGVRYFERYAKFSAIVKAKYPEIQLVVSAGPAPAGEPFDSMWAHWRETKADIVDEHYYMNPDWFLANAHRYDNYDRSGPKVFAGEYAAQTAGTTRPDNSNNWKAALSEAAFMTGLERNGDVVRMASYAPLLANAEAWQWKPDAIWFDNLRSYGTPNYYVQSLFANHAGTRVVPITSDLPGRLYTSATLDEPNQQIIVKAINAKPEKREATIRLQGLTFTGTVKVFTLASDDLNMENSFDQPKRLSPQSSTAECKAGTLHVWLPSNSVAVYRIPIH